MAKRIYLFTKTENERKKEIFSKLNEYSARCNIYATREICTSSEIKTFRESLTEEEQHGLEEDALFLLNIWKRPWFTIELSLKPVSAEEALILPVNSVVDVSLNAEKGQTDSKKILVQSYKGVYNYIAFQMNATNKSGSFGSKFAAEKGLSINDLLMETVPETSLKKIRSELGLDSYYFIYTEERNKIIFIVLTSGISLITQNASIVNNPYFTKMNHFQALDNFALIGSKKADISILPDRKVLKAGFGEGEIKVTVPHEGKNIGIQTDKLIRYSNGLIYQTGSSHITFSLSDYMRKLNYPIDEDPNAKDPAKEKARASAAYKDGKKKVSKELKTLYDASFSFKNGSDFFDQRILTKKGIVGDTVIMKFEEGYANALKKSHVVTDYSNALYGVDPQEAANAYRIGKKMCEHYNNETNLAAGRANRLKVETLLKVTDLPNPSDESFVKNRLSWKRRILDPFNEALAKLEDSHVIDSYEYTHEKGIKLTDEEAQNIQNYDVFISLYVEFNLSNAPDHTEGIQKKKARAKIRDKKNHKVKK